MSAVVAGVLSLPDSRLLLLLMSMSISNGCAERLFHNSLTEWGASELEEGTILVRESATVESTRNDEDAPNINSYSNVSMDLFSIFSDRGCGVGFRPLSNAREARFVGD